MCSEGGCNPMGDYVPPTPLSAGEREDLLLLARTLSLSIDRSRQEIGVALARLLDALDAAEARAAKAEVALEAHFGTLFGAAAERDALKVKCERAEASAGSIECPHCAHDIPMALHGAHSGDGLDCPDCGGRAVLTVESVEQMVERNARQDVLKAKCERLREAGDE